MTIQCRINGESDFAISPIRGIMNGTARCVNTRRSLTRSLDLGEEGLAMKATQSQSAERMAARFWAKVNRDGPVPAHCPEIGQCWVWTKACQAWGYGKFSVAKSVWEGAHRVSWKMANGPIPDGMNVCHRCDNPPCVRPSHLFLGSLSDNSRDMHSKGRGRTGAKGVLNSNAKVTEEQVIAIRTRFAAGERGYRLAAEFGIAPRGVSRMVTGETWKHAGGPIQPFDSPRRKAARNKNGQKRRSLKVTCDDVAPSLRFASAQIKKAERSSAPAGSQREEANPWTEEPPF